MCVIILAGSDDPHAGEVCIGLKRMNQETIYFDLLAEPPPSIAISDRNSTFALCGIDVVTAVFVHYPLQAGMRKFAAEREDHRLALAAWRETMQWIEVATLDAKWIPPSLGRGPPRDLPTQLKCAGEIGFQTPPALWTNSAQILKSFFSIDQKVIIKPSTASVHVDPEHRILSNLIDLSSVSEEHLSRSPCLFQGYIEKDYELRVYVIGDEIIPIKIESQVNETSSIDWRRYLISATPHSVVEISSDLSAMCSKLTRNLGLPFAAIDIVVQKDGSNCFLECNSSPHWLWIDKLLHAGITESLCRLLSE